MSSSCKSMMEQRMKTASSFMPCLYAWSNVVSWFAVNKIVHLWADHNRVLWVELCEPGLICSEMTIESCELGLYARLGSRKKSGAKARAPVQVARISYILFVPITFCVWASCKLGPAHIILLVAELVWTLSRTSLYFIHAFHLVELC